MNAISTLYWETIQTMLRGRINATGYKDITDALRLMVRIELHMYICFGIITLLLIALIVIVLIKKK